MVNVVAAQSAAASPVASLVGRLATVEPAERRVTMMPEGEVDLVEIFVAENGEVLHDDERLTLPELVIRVGRRATIVYREVGERRVADRIVIEPEG
jgi:hypothetical protein